MNGTIALPRVASVNRRIFRAASMVAAAGVAVKVAATFKEFTVAGAYGRSDAMDAFLAAFLIPNLLINLISESMNQALIPTLIRVRIQQGHARAQELLSNSMVSLCVLLAAVSVVMGVMASYYFPMIAANFPAIKLGLSVRLFYALLPVVLLSGIASNCTAVLNTFERFALPALIPVVAPVSIIAGTLLLRGRFGIWAVVYSTLAGAAIHAGLAGGMMRAQGYRFRLQWYGMNDAGREVRHQYGAVLLSSVVASGGLLVDQAMAGMLPAGSVSALVFAGRFVSVVVTLMAGAISSAIVPYFSTMIAEKDWDGCRNTLRTWVGLTAMIAAPIAALLMAGSHFLVGLTLQHGAFSADDTTVVSRVLVMYAMQIPFFVVSRVYYRFLVAMRRTDVVLYCGAINLILDCCLNLVLMRWLGVAGIALSTSLWTISTLVFLRYWTRRVLSAVEAR